MRKIKKLDAMGLYLVACRSTSHEAFFENPSQLRTFKNQFRRHLDGICDIIERIHLPTGYAYIIATKSAEAIEEWYLSRRKMGRKRVSSQPFEEVWRMISEGFRLMGASFVSITNRRSGRQGTKFRTRYERYEFENEEELRYVVALIREGNIQLDQKNPTYRTLSKKTKWFQRDSEKHKLITNLESTSSAKNIFTRALHSVWKYISMNIYYAKDKGEKGRSLSVEAVLL